MATGLSPSYAAPMYGATPLTALTGLNSVEKTRAIEPPAFAKMSKFLAPSIPAEASDGNPEARYCATYA